MDRRVVVGLVGIALGGVVGSSWAQTAPRRDPSAQPSVSLSPIPTIGDTINNTTGFSPVVPVASPGVPSSPVGPGQEATFPKSPIPSDPVSIAPMEPLQRSITRGFGFGTFGSMFRKPADRPPAPIMRATPRVEPAPKFSTTAVPSIWSDPPQGQGPRGGRPAPFAGRAPEAPRAQADLPAGSPAAPNPGRPAPFAEDRPRSARPRAAASNVPAYRPAEIPAAIPEPVVAAPAPGPVTPLPEPAAPTPAPVPSSTVVPAPIEPIPPAAPTGPEPVVPAPTLREPTPPTAPAELPPPPAIEPASALPAIVPDPIQGLEPVPPLELPAAVALAPVEADPPPAQAPAPALAPLPATPKGLVDPAVGRTSQDAVAIRTGPVQARNLPHATMRAAAVGDEIITFNELKSSVEDEMKARLGGEAGAMSDAERHELNNMVASSILNRMIDQALVIQEAKRKMQKNPKAKQAFDEEIDKEWKAKELPPLLRNTASANVHELKVKLAAEGKSYEAMKEQYRKNMLFHEFLRSEIRYKLNADLPEMKAYYNDHLAEFEQPARMTWREIEINTARYPGRVAARQKAEEVLARLLRDEDFAAVARSVSNGPTASKGGVYVDMQPGSYGIPVVNDELNRLPIGQVSQILEAPGAFHIIRVDSRREKGPLGFSEVQDKIRAIVINQNGQKAVEDYMAKLRGRTLIRTMFDNTASDPEIARRNDPAVRAASNR